LWDFGDGTTNDSIEPSHLYTELGIYDVGLEVWTRHGCYGSLLEPQAVEVIGRGIMEFPNVFAPNPDGPIGGEYDPTSVANNIFFPVHDGVIEYNLQIYSRWGELVFETDDVGEGWDGYIDGKMAPQAVFIYKVEGIYANGKTFKHLGDVTVLHKKPF
jgi:gliding motility-associated-like protein